MALAGGQQEKCPATPTLCAGRERTHGTLRGAPPTSGTTRALGVLIADITARMPDGAGTTPTPVSNWGFEQDTTTPQEAPLCHWHQPVLEQWIAHTGHHLFQGKVTRPLTRDDKLKVLNKLVEYGGHNCAPLGIAGAVNSVLAPVPARALSRDPPAEFSKDELDLLPARSRSAVQASSQALRHMNKLHRLYLYALNEAYTEAEETSHQLAILRKAVHTAPSLAAAQNCISAAIGDIPAVDDQIVVPTPDTQQRNPQAHFEHQFQRLRELRQSFPAAQLTTSQGPQALRSFRLISTLLTDIRLETHSRAKDLIIPAKFVQPDTNADDNSPHLQSSDRLTNISIADWQAYKRNKELAKTLEQTAREAHRQFKPNPNRKGNGPPARHQRPRPYRESQFRPKNDRRYPQRNKTDHRNGGGDGHQNRSDSSTKQEDKQETKQPPRTTQPHRGGFGGKRR